MRLFVRRVRNSFRTALLAALTIAAIPAAAGAANYEIAPGSSIASVTSQMQPGDTLCAHGGTYAFRNYPDWQMPSGTAAAPITVKNCAGETPVFDGGMVSGEFMIPSGKAYWVIDGLTVTHFDNSSGNGAITPANGSHDIEFRNMTFRDNGSQADNDHDIYIGGCSDSCRVHDIRIHHNRFINGPGGALHMWHYREGYNISFYDNLVVNKRTGAYVCDAATNVRIYHNTFVNTTNTGGRGTIVTSCGQQVNGAESLYVRNNIIYRAGGNFWQRGAPAPNTVCGSGSCPNAQVEDHNIWRCGGSCSFEWTPDPTDKTSDPLFVDLANGDYRLQSGSSAIDAGTSVDAATNDFAYAPRPQGMAFDIGAYEAGGTPPPPPPPADTTPPTAPTNLQATSPACTDGTCAIHVTWTASTDNVGIDHYNNYRPLGNKVGEDPGSATSTDFGGSLPRCSTQTLGLEAEDAAHNKSTVATITAKTYCPSLDITNFRRDAAKTTKAEIFFTWTPPTASVSSYREYRDGYPSNVPTAQDGVLTSSELASTSPGSATSDSVGGSLPCGTTWLVGIEAVGTDGTVGPRNTQTMVTAAC